MVVAIFFLSLVGGIALLNWMKISLDDAKIVSEILFMLVQISAIVIAGIWTYNRFIKNREDYPYPRLQHRVEHQEMENGTVYLSVFVTVSNEGKTKLDIFKGEIHVRRVKPVSPELRPHIVWRGKTNQKRDGIVPELFSRNNRTVDWRQLEYRKWEWENPEKQGKNVLSLEPGQAREIQFDFFLPPGLQTIQILSSFDYADTYCELSKLYSLDEEDAMMTKHKDRAV